MPFNESERNLVGLLARYHRKALPKPEHPIYENLTEQQRRRVHLLAGILRVADGLDRTHRSIVERVDVQVTGQTLILRCCTKGPAPAEMAEASKKSVLLHRSTGREIKIISA